jgi:hypothetical protein
VRDDESRALVLYTFSIPILILAVCSITTLRRAPAPVHDLIPYPHADNATRRRVDKERGGREAWSTEALVRVDAAGGRAAKH